MEILSWGKSMYGGWYVNYLKDGKIDGKHFLKLKELKDFIGKIPELIKRFDN